MSVMFTPLISHIIIGGFLGFVVPLFNGVNSFHGLLLNRRSVLTYFFECHLVILVRRHDLISLTCVQFLLVCLIITNQERLVKTSVNLHHILGT